MELVSDNSKNQPEVLSSDKISALYPGGAENTVLALLHPPSDGWVKIEGLGEVTEEIKDKIAICEFLGETAIQPALKAA